MLTDSIAALEAGLDALVEADLVGLGRDELLEVVQRIEKFRRRLSVLDHRLVAEVGDRSLARELCMPSTSVLLQRLLRLSPERRRGGYGRRLTSGHDGRWWGRCYRRCSPEWRPLR